ncbi:MAG: glycosyl transferase family 2 [Verrucomicrobiales bacterium]|nr:glycosyl transferase family 2 [Verrucomicrobiales bacterium]
MPTPLISICVPNLNKAKFLSERMETLLAQTFRDWEMIVCDSYSNDGSWELLQKFKSDPRIQLHQVPREGLYAGWNECIKRARGEYINFATSDDTANPLLLEKLLQPLECRSDLHLSVCDFEEIDEQSKSIKPRTLRFRDFLGKWLDIPSIRNGKTEFLTQTVFITNWFTMAAVLFRRSLLNKTGIFRTDQRSFADSDWALRASLASDIANVPGKWTTFRVSAEQATPRVNTTDDWKIYCDSLARILNECASQIPSEWQQLPGWREKLLRYRRDWHLDSLHLYRWFARENPVEFLSGTMHAAVSEPNWLIKQALRGFPERRAEHDRNASDEAHDLIRFFNAQWPPIEVSQW